MTSTTDQPNLTALAADIVAAFVSGNSLPAAELPALIHSVEAALRRLSTGAPGVAAPSRKTRARRLYPQVGHAGLPHLLGRRKAVQITTPASSGTWDDAGRLSGKMGVARRLSDGRAELCGRAFQTGEGDGAGSIAQKGGCEGRPQAEGKRVERPFRHPDTNRPQ